MKKVEEVVAVIERGDGEELPALKLMMREILLRLGDDLGIYAARLYARDGDGYFLRGSFPDEGEARLGFRVPRSYPPVDLCLSMGTVYMEPGDLRIDPEVEKALGVEEFAAIEIAGENYMMGFSIAPGHDREDILSSLAVMRRAFNERIRRERVESDLRQAQLIQASILPKKAPAYAGYSIAGRHVSVDRVGGDIYDFIPISDKILGIAIADASGHGLPAALQVRDIYVGMRMGLGRDFKMVRTIERLNAIINESSLTSRFVSMFYGELEEGGIFLYCNAGHPPAFHLGKDGAVTYLKNGGPVLGPLPKATYGRGMVQMAPGDILVLFTDGFTEALKGGDSTRNDEYGAERLVEVARTCQGCSADEVIDAIFASVAEWTGDAPLIDDRTLVVVVVPDT
jgi:serine phosphatase RsbU (regulator of sigma subunit)